MCASSNSTRVGTSYSFLVSVRRRRRWIELLTVWVLRTNRLSVRQLPFPVSCKSRSPALRAKRRDLHRVYSMPNTLRGLTSLASINSANAGRNRLQCCQVLTERAIGSRHGGPSRFPFATTLFRHQGPPLLLGLLHLRGDSHAWFLFFGDSSPSSPTMSLERRLPSSPSRHFGNNGHRHHSRPHLPADSCLGSRRRWRSSMHHPVVADSGRHP